jgi:hypothetical protein
LGFVFDLPLWIVGLALVVLMGGLAGGGLLFVRRRILPRHRIAEGDGHFTATMVHSIMVLYSLTVALIAISVWETHVAAAKIVSAEATSVAALYRDVSGYPPPVQAQLQDTLRDYVESVIEEAWPEQHQGRVPRGGVERIDRFQQLLTGFEPATEGQKILHAETLRAYDHMVEARRLRLDAVQTALPGLMWTVIFVVLAFDRPFRGDLGIDSEPYELVYDQLMNR